MNWLLKLIDKKYRDLSISFEVALKDAENLKCDLQDLQDINEALKATVHEYGEIIDRNIDAKKVLSEKIHKKFMPIGNAIEEALKYNHLKYSHIGNSAEENHK